MKETDRQANNQMRMVAKSLEAVAHHYVNPDAAHFEESSNIRRQKARQEKDYLDNKNPFR